MEKLNFSRKLTVCLLAGLIAAAVFHRMAAKYFTDWPVTVIWATSLSALLACIIYLFIWQQRERKGNINSPAVMAFFQGCIIYAIAFDLSTFGWQKIFHLQMIVPLGVLDLPFSSLSGEQLTWAYFGRSYPYTVAIAISQMLSAYLLLFRKTRLLGLIIMVPVLGNIIMIDSFYRMPAGVLIHAIILFAGIIYLLLLHYKELAAFFFRRSNPSLIALKPGIRNMARIALVVIPLILLAGYNFPNKHPRLTGKYAVKNLVVNNHPLKAASVRDSVLTTLYMDLENDLVLEFNHFNNRYIGTYDYNPQNNEIAVNWRYPAGNAGPLEGKLLPAETGSDLRFQGRLGKDSIKMELVRAEP